MPGLRDLANQESQLKVAAAPFLLSRSTLMKYAFCVALMLGLSATCLAAADVRCGAAAVNIEADDSMVIGGGIGPGKATGQEGELRAVAVVLQKPGAAKVAIVACDVLFVSRDYVDRALAEIARTTGIPA